jgi:hypothetical protein
MAESLPSAVTVIADVPEVKSFRACFKYNFFQKDERVNESGRAAAQFIRKRSSESFDADFQESDQFNRFTARYVSLNWQPVAELDTFVPVDFKIANNIDKISEEQHFIADHYSNMSFQDVGADTRLNYFVKKLARQIRDLETQTDEPVTSSVEESGLDIVKSIIPSLSDDIDPSILCEALVNPEAEGFLFTNRDGQKITNTSLVKDLRKVKFFAQANNKHLVDILKTVPENSFSIFEDEVDEYIEEIRNIQEKTITENNSNLLDARNYNLEIPEFVSYRVVDPEGFKPRFQVVGYLIEKIEIAPDGTSVVKDPIVVESPNINTTVDVKIKYGMTYKYMIRSVAMFESMAMDTNSEQNVVVQYLVASKPSPIEQIECVEKVPPPCPSDFNVRWDSVNKWGVLEWSFPVNTQQDIKGWQIFRRETTDEPFELLKVYDFDDSLVKGKDPQADRPDPLLVETMTNPKQFYIDKDFNKESKYIYAVASVDARGLSSNYSMQFEVSFNRFQNKLVKRLLSLKGAPKAYPNFFLREDAFVDTIRDSGHKKLRIVFNPEYLRVIDSSLNDLKLLKLQRDSLYQLSMINVDLQLQENVQIKLLDKRKSSDKNTSSKQQNRLLQNRRSPFDRLWKEPGRRKK